MSVNLIVFRNSHFNLGRRFLLLWAAFDSLRHELVDDLVVFVGLRISAPLCLFERVVAFSGGKVLFVNFKNLSVGVRFLGLLPKLGFFD